MTWNEPGKNKDNDPWTGKNRSTQGPPDLDAMLRNFSRKIAGLFSRNPSSGSPDSNNSEYHAGALISLVFIALFALWFLSGLFIIDPANRGVVLRFGKYESTLDPGLHWIPRIIDSVTVVNEQKISSYSYEAQMLTKDENIVSVAIAVQFRIFDARDFLYNVTSPQESLQQATASALRQVIGHMNLNEILTSGRELIRSQVQEQLSSILKIYKTGLLITDVTILPAKAPEEVKEAFDDAIKAQEDEQRIINQAEAYAMQVEPIAKGQANRLLADANAYKQQIVLKAQGETARFTSLLPQYKKAPDLTRARMYFDTLEQVYNKASKILLDTKNTNQLFYLPLDKLVQSNNPNENKTEATHD